MEYFLFVSINLKNTVIESIYDCTYAYKNTFYKLKIVPFKRNISSISIYTTKEIKISILQ